MEAPLISIIMPVYNAESFVKKSVESILSQTFSNFEIICVNDCSRDNSLAILNSLKEKDSRVKVIDSAVNVGAGAARNLGIEAARGEYITFVDADDTIEPDLLYRAISLCDNGKIDQVVWGILEKHYTADGRLVKTLPVTPENQSLCDFDAITKAVLKLENQTLFGYQCNSIYRSKIIKENNIRFEKTILYEDFFFNLEFARYMTSLASFDYAGYTYFKRANMSITHSFVKDYFELSYRRVENMLDFCKGRNYTAEEVYNILGNRLLRYTLSAVSRNLKPQAEMSRKNRKEWFLSLAGMPLYSELMPKCKPSNIVYALLKFAVTHKQYLLVSIFGRMINIIG